MIEVIVNVRDAVFAALVAWTGVGDAEPPKPVKDTGYALQCSGDR